MTELFRLLSDLLAFPTVSHTPNSSLISYLEDLSRDLGFSCKKIPHPEDSGRSNLLCTIGPEKEGGLMLSGHTDVVPTIGQDWHTDPFLLTAKNGAFYGRGSTDMKGFIAATYLALRKIDFKKLTKPLTLLWTYDEEIGCRGSFVAAPLLRNHLVHLPQDALIGEPTDFQILRMHSGHVTISIKTKGKGAHSSDPSLGINAIKAMNQILAGIFDLENELKQEQELKDYFKRPFVTLNVGQIRGGSAVNIIADEAHASIGFRPLPTSSVEDIFQRIQTRALESCQVEGAKVDVILEHCSPAMMTHEGSKLEKILKPHAQKGSEVAAAFSTDAGNLRKEGINCLIYGPGSISIAHQANEYILEKDLLLAIPRLEQIINAYCT